MFKAFMLLMELKAFMSTSLNFNVYAYIVSLCNYLNIFNHKPHVGEEAAGQFTLKPAIKLKYQAWFGDHKPVLIPQIKFIIRIIRTSC